MNEPETLKKGNILTVVEDKMSEFKAQKIPWTELAKYLCKINEEDKELFYDILDKRRINEIIRSYRFIEAQRPDLIHQAANIAPCTICYLPVIYKRMPDEPGKDDTFQEIIDKVLSGEFNYDKLKFLSKTFSSQEKLKKKSETAPPAKRIIESDKDVAQERAIAVDRAIELTTYLIDEALKTTTYAQLQALLADKAMSLSIKLNCIADEEYRRLYEQKKEFRL